MSLIIKGVVMFRPQERSTLLPMAAAIFQIAAILACSRGPSEKAVIAAYEQAFNSHAVDSLSVLFGDSIQVEFVGMGPILTSKEILVDKARYDSVLDAHVTVNIGRLANDTVFASAVETNKWLSRAGLPPSVYSSLMFVISNGRITDLQAQLSDSSVTAINNVMQDLISWAQSNEPDKLNELLPQGTFSYSINTANLSLELLRDWQNRK
jgi:hypothetical protein